MASRKSQHVSVECVAPIGSARLTLAQILSSLSYALDLTEGQPMGHSIKSCLIGMRIGSDYGLSDAELCELHYGLLMKDAGCSSNAARLYAIFGCDDLKTKRDVKIIDWCRLSEAVRFAIVHTLPGGSFINRAKKMLAMAGPPSKAMQAVTQARCSRGSEIALSLGLGEDAARAIYSLDEHWDGGGAPHGLAGENIPLYARIACLAQTLEVFVTTFELGHAMEVINARRGTWFDPKLVDVANGIAGDAAFWKTVMHRSHEAIDKMNHRFGVATQTDIDAVCNAFAGIVDAKSSFTAEHSFRVQEYAIRIAETFGYAGERLALIRRAALLHDIGKLAVPNSILDKPGKLTADEYDIVKLHPYHTWQILKGIPGFERMAEVAGAHHEKLDGSGYFRGFSAKQLDRDMRILAVADAFDAMTADRPYKKAMEPDHALSLLETDADITLDRACVEALAGKSSSFVTPALAA